MEKTIEVLAQVGTGRTIHAGYSYEGEKGIFVSCGAVRHSGSRVTKAYGAKEVTCKKCLAAMEEKKVEEKDPARQAR